MSSVYSKQLVIQQWIKSLSREEILQGSKARLLFRWCIKNVRSSSWIATRRQQVKLLGMSVQGSAVFSSPSKPRERPLQTSVTFRSQRRTSPKRHRLDKPPCKAVFENVHRGMPNQLLFPNEPRRRHPPPVRHEDEHVWVLVLSSFLSQQLCGTDQTQHRPLLLRRFQQSACSSPSGTSTHSWTRQLWSRRRHPTLIFSVICFIVLVVPAVSRTKSRRHFVFLVFCSHHRPAPSNPISVIHYPFTLVWALTYQQPRLHEHQQNGSASSDFPSQL